MKLIKKIPPRYLIICVVILVVLFLSYFRIFNNFELITYDFRLKLRPPLKVSEDILIIEISDDTLINLGKWPLPRDFHASLIEVLNKYQAKFIVFDVLFSEPTVFDELLSQTIAKEKNVYLALAYYLDPQTKSNYPFPESSRILADISSGLNKSAAGSGHINVFTDPDGKIRKIPLFIKDNSRLIPHLGFLTACKELNLDIDKIEIEKNSLTIDKKLSVPYRPSSFFLINYPAKWGKDFSHLSYFQILKAHNDRIKGNKPNLDLSIIKDKICFIGLTAAGTSDLKATPLQNIYPMLGLQASVFNGLVQKNFLKDAGILLNTAINLIVFLLGFFICLKFLPLKALLVNTVFGLVYGLIAIGLLTFYGLWIDLFLPLSIIVVNYVGFTLFRFLEAVQERKILEKELDIAYKIQKSFLPLEIKEFANLDIFSFSHPAKFVAGDFYDIFALNQKTLGVLIGDVSGKGVSASLIMAQTISLFRIFARQYPDCREVISQLNNELCQRLKGRFVTTMYLTIDTENRRLRVCSAGQGPLLIFKKEENKIYEKDICAELPLGVMPEVEYKMVEFNINKGDRIFVFTDGLNEARNRKGKEFGMENIKQTLIQGASLDSQLLVKNLKDRLFKFSASAAQFDDITLIAVKMKD